ncbi:nuclear transport factor 2 family protein [Winogradskyella sp. DF17]|uniref:histidine kinase n=1 Tax=Winogradskyella pelagia TaxID=2819984 RepID=A0ABS3T369_9FLAO|nr:ATP-binding protein [Winogradskyella sp. DF17]MBO3117172.1 nuclear transport factor 2 family protein [Winogradskyella sp. DF17]
MQLTKTKEKEILKVYNTWMQAYLNDDVITYNSYFDDDYHFIGSTDNEEFLDRKETTKFFELTGEQFAGMMDLRNETKTLEQFDEHIFITHFCDVWFLNKEQWTYYGRFRLSSIMHRAKQGWRFLYQHFSMPDSKSEEGQTIGFDKINAENQELREAIQRRTTELEQKNRELEIASALNHIRAEATSMKKSSDLLDIVVTMRNEFIKLGHEAQYFWHMMWGTETYEKAMTSGDGSRIGFVMTLPRHIHGDIPLLAKWEKSNEPTVVHAMNVEEAIDYVDKMVNLGDFKSIDPQAPSQDDIRHIGGLTFIMARTTHGEIGYSLPGIVKNPPKEALKLLVQFAGAFDLAHRRFLDLKKSEQQSREVEIELALEKVRSRTMAMQKSEELSEASFLLDAQVRELGIKTWGCAFNIYGEEESKEWFGNEKGELTTYNVPRTGIFKEYYDKGQDGETLLIREFSGEDCVAHYEFMSTLPGIGQVLKQLKKTNKGFPTFQIDHVVYFRYGYLLFITRESVPEAHDIFKRFAKVFEQTYTRFLDLQKAEAQAREAQIEAALERVRAKSMAMQSSDELETIIQVVHDQFVDLGITLDHAGFIMDYKTNDDMIIWLADEHKVTPQIRLSYFDSPHWNSYIEAKEKGHQLFVNHLDFKVKNKFYKEIFKYIPQLPKEAKTFYLQIPSLTIATALVDTIGLYIENFSGVQYNEEDQKILLRFAEAFQQTYTRFLDLQKAEAQARESQIEAALEKVRSRSLAVHKSEEFKEVVSIVFEKLKELQIPATAVGIGVKIKGSKNLNSYVCGENEAGLVITNYRLPYFNNEISKDLCNVFDKESNLFKGHYSKKVKDSFYKYILEETPEFKSLPDDILSMIFNSQSYTITMVASDQVVFNINDFEGNDLAEHEIDILKRFSRVFNQAYIRFLDLLKAEAQARESQINLAVERVRAQALAMHKSEEIMKVVAKLKDEVMSLDIPNVVAATIFLNEGDDKVRMWDLSTLDINDTNDYEVPFDITFKLKKKDPDLYVKRVWENKDDFFVEVQKGKDFKRIIAWLRENDQIKVADEVEEYTISTELKELYHAVKKLNNGKLVIDLMDPPSEEMQTILTKMGAAFDLAYKRFEDLQRAEAQTREAQIEAALEKIRSRSLAMHKPEELQEVVAVVAKKLKDLGVIFDAGGVILCTYFPDNKDVMHWISADDFSYSGNYLVPYFENPIFDNAWDSKMRGDAYFSEEFSVEVKNDFFTHCFEHSDYKNFPDEFKQHALQAKQHHLSAAWSKNSAIIIPSLTGVIPSDSDADILKRFAKVFEQAYIRFMDLQKAEAQAREAQVEMSLEKVRSRTMAMQASSELPQAANTLFLEVQALGIPAWSAGYCIWEDDSKTSASCNMSSEGVIQKEFSLPTIGEGYDFFTPQKNGESFYVKELGGKKLVKHYEFMTNLPIVGEIFKDFEAKGIALPTFQIFHICYFKHGYVMFITYESVPNAHDIFKRFTGVFEQTYTRFLDLERAEAQTREAQIEMALEKVRSRTMAMQKGEELQEVVVLLYKELIKLGVTNFVTCGYVEINEATQRQSTWVTNPGGDSLGLFHLPLTGDATFDARYKAWKEQQEVFHQTVAGKVRQKHLEYAITTFNSKEAEEMVMQQFPDPTVFYCFNFPQGYLHIVSGSRLDKAEEILMARFTRVFEQTYTRFLDLERAEAQAREAQIEMALEKVRSRTMAMQHSDELQDAAQVLFNEITGLGIPSWSCGYNVLSDDKKSCVSWMSSEGQYQKPFTLIFEKEASFIEMYEFFKSDETLLVQELSGKAIEDHYDYMKTLPTLIPIFKDFDALEIPIPEYQINHLCKFSKGYLLFITYKKVPDAHNVFKRFTKVFEQTYTRFLDLKQAEARARESQIQSALERVRSQSMGMQSTADFGEVTTEMFTQLRNFGEDLFATGIVFCDKRKGHVEQWHSIPGGGMLSPMIVPIDLDYIHQYRYDQWKTGKELFSIEIPSDFIEQHFEDIFKLPSAQITLKDLEERNAPMPAPPPWEIDYGASFKNGYLLISSLKPLENTDILPRFAKVFEQAYTRFLDLQTAEKNAYKSRVETALERVRARALAMQEPDELRDVASVLRTEMGLLGIEELETCSIYILDDDVSNAECWYALKDAKSKSKKLISDHISMDFSKTWVGKQMLNFHDSDNETTSIAMKGAQRKEWIHYCAEQSKALQTYYGDDIPERTYHLHKFSNGAIGAASAVDISEESWVLLKRCASVFSLAYSRFKDLTQAKIDLKRLKTEKKRAEEALSELQTTQKQLIQSEKMASLGELTAGIAHEIQNPLNFVNNFSEVSKELLEEMQEEIDNGDVEEAKAIMEDIIQNLEKINHHGKRADGIVKGMLQHSRANGDKKEPTDINALADEYLRLAYHGLRAKDQSFNAELVTDFDESIETVDIIPQDIGRVILNLLTNAFYVVNEKKKTGIEDYKPTVSISTKKKSKVIEIRVTDNGNGMPESLKEKIFQPFFTTKPTGEGTGLGLSLSYDIITKGHGGDLKVVSKEGEGTTFTIEIPHK